MTGSAEIPETDPAAGLSGPEARQRLVRFGPNTAMDVRRQPLWIQFILRFRNPLIILLMIASALAALTGDKASFFIIISMVLLSVILDFFQEVRAENIIDSLRLSVANKAAVLRDGAEVDILTHDIVPGDVIFLSPGALVPADGRLHAVKDLYVNQALLTGEAFPVEKAAAAGSPENEVFMGTSVISGTATVVVTQTGRRTRLGGIAGTLAKKHPPTSFEKGIQDFGMMILRLVVGMVLFVMLVNLGFHRPPLESFLFALALAVGLTPELLPMLMTITLSRGAMRMAKKQVIVKHLPAMHNLGAMDVLCTDKTGTLTEADIKMTGTISAEGQPSDHVALLAFINSYFESGIKSPLDAAIIAAGHPDIAAWRKIDEVPFDFERRRVSVLAERGNRRFLIVKGAPEDILNLSTHYETKGGQATSMNDEARQSCLDRFGQAGRNGMRVLAVAFREVDAGYVTAHITDEMELTFAGFATFLDPPKESAAKAIRNLSTIGVTVKIITGDNEQVTRHLCQMLDFNPGRILTGDAIAHMGDEALGASLDETHVFCRVTPHQKSRVIAALKARGHAVGFLGDGINDAAALHEADAGISVDSGTDVAKAAADIILLDKDLSVLYEGVLEGRRAVENTEKYILMGSSSNFGNMFSMAGASLFLPFLPMLPTQILLNNLLYDASQTVLPLDSVDPEAIIKPVRWDIKQIRKFMWILGPLSSLFDFVTFYALLRIFPGNEVLFRTGWFVESIVTQVLIVLAIRTHKSIFVSRPHPSLLMMSLTIAAVGMALPFTPLGQWFDLASLPATFFIFLFFATLTYFTLVEAVKYTLKSAFL